MVFNLRRISSLSAGLRRVFISANYLHGGVARSEIDLSPLTVLEFFVPGHLDGFELGFVGGRGVAGEAGEFGDPFVHVGKADGEGIGVRKFVGQADGDVFEIVPTECGRHVWLLLKVFSIQWSVVSGQLREKSKYEFMSF